MKTFLTRFAGDQQLNMITEDLKTVKTFVRILKQSDWNNDFAGSYYLIQEV